MFVKNLKCFLIKITLKILEAQKNHSKHLYIRFCTPETNASLKKWSVTEPNRLLLLACRHAFNIILLTLCFLQSRVTCNLNFLKVADKNVPERQTFVSSLLLRTCLYPQLHYFQPSVAFNLAFLWFQPRYVPFYMLVANFCLIMNDPDAWGIMGVLLLCTCVKWRKVWFCM